MPSLNTSNLSGFEDIKRAPSAFDTLKKYDTKKKRYKTIQNHEVNEQDYACFKKDLYNKTATQVWNIQKKVLESRKICMDQYYFLLISYCNSYAQRLEAEAKLKKQGFVIQNIHGAVINPYLRVMQICDAQLIKTGGLLGLDPVNCNRVVLPPEELQTEFDGF